MRRGSILIDWKVEQTPESHRLLFRWQEKDGPPVTPPLRKGFGSQVLERGLALELEGTVHLD
jgi:two-component sensor histidine kinase